MSIWWAAVLSLLVLELKYLLDAQLTPPSEPVCPGNHIIFSCHHTGRISRWTITLPSMLQLQNSTQMPAGSIITFLNDPGFHFELHIVSNGPNIFISKLQVIARSGLDGATVNCAGPEASQQFTSSIQVVSIAAPSGVMTINEQFTKPGAVINVSWSTSSAGAENYTVRVIPPAVPGQIFNTTGTSLQLIAMYNVNYTINITAQNCAGSNSTILHLLIAGCSPPPPLTNGIINGYVNGSIGASLTYQCNTGYIPREQMTSTCMANSSWVPIPQCTLEDCGTPIVSGGVVIESFNSTQFNGMILFHCEEGLIPDTIIKAVCESTGVWNPNPALHLCVNQSSVSCRAPIVPSNAHIRNQSNYIYLEGTKVTFQCDNRSQALLTVMCYTNGSWSPRPSQFNCNRPEVGDGLNSNVAIYIGISASTPFLLLFLIIIILVVILKMKQSVKSKLPRDLNQDGNEYYEATHLRRNYDQNRVQYMDLDYNVINHPATSEGDSNIPVTHSGGGNTLIYADLGPSSSRMLKPSHIDDTHRVIYSKLNHAVSLPMDLKEPEHDIDATLNLDSLLIQLKPEVTSKWKEFAHFVGLSDMIKKLAKYSPEECLVEVCDHWLKNQSNKLSWRDVAHVVNKIGLYQLADDILIAYKTGELPIMVDMDAVPDNIKLSDNETLPPLPPRLTEMDTLSSELNEYDAEQYKDATPSPPKTPVQPPKP